MTKPLTHLQTDPLHSLTSDLLLGGADALCLC